LSYPGSKLYPYNYIAETPEKFINQIIPLSEVPINAITTFIFNNANNVMTYAKSSGASAIKRKDVRKLKLVYIELPSGVLRLFPSYTNCILADAKNIYLNKVVEGGWGYFLKAKKHIVVRGVAMNPVDHPNGGRTKAKQPELSP
jgi:large subunit ribosomal protein L2